MVANPSQPAQTNQSSAPAPKSTGKAPLKSFTLTGSQSKKQKKRKGSSPVAGMQFRSAIKACTKETISGGTCTLANSSLRVLCGIAHQLFEDIIICSSDLAKKVGKQTITTDDVKTSVDLMLTGELKNLAVRQVNDSVSKLETQNK